MPRHFTTARMARKIRVCSSCQRYIHKGDRYLTHVAPPDAPDLNNEHWWRIAECSACATRYGRGPLLETGQPQEAPDAEG